MAQQYRYALCVLLGGFLFFLIGQNFTSLSRPLDYKFEVQDVDTEIKFNNKPSRGKTRVFRYDGTELIRLAEFCTWTVHLDCVTLKTPFGPTPIHIHDVKADRWVSGNIKRYGSWEHANVKLVIEELKKDPELGFMDLGSHVGAFSLSVAKFGRKVVSVDPLVENVQRLCKSIQKGGFTDQMTIIFNPLSDTHTTVSFRREVGNVGGTSVIAASKQNRTRSPCEESSDSPTVMLDDLLPLIPFRKAVLKMDVQEHEFKVLKGGHNFFKEVHVTAILMEWVMMKTDPSAPNLIKLLTGYNFRAFSPSIESKLLDTKRYGSWPYDVIWRRQ